MPDDYLLNAFVEDGIVQAARCPNVTPGADCVDPNCTYCRIAAAENPKPRSKED